MKGLTDNFEESHSDNIRNLDQTGEIHNKLMPNSRVLQKSWAKQWLSRNREVKKSNSLSKKWHSFAMAKANFVIFLGNCKVLRFWPNTWIFVPSRDREVPHNFMTATLECSSFRNKTKYDDLQDSLCRSTRTKSCEMSYWWEASYSPLRFLCTQLVVK